MSVCKTTDHGEAQRWFVVRTGHKQERLALASLPRGAVDGYLPMLPKQNRKGELYAVPLFPSFMFIRFGARGSCWPLVFAARGVLAALGSCGEPSAISQVEMELIRFREVAAFEKRNLAAPRGDVHFEKGEQVRFRKGPWAELDALFVEQVDARRCKVLLQLLGSAREAEAELEHVEGA